MSAILTDAGEILEENLPLVLNEKFIDKFIKVQLIFVIVWIMLYAYSMVQKPKMIELAKVHSSQIKQHNLAVKLAEGINDKANELVGRVIKIWKITPGKIPVDHIDILTKHGVTLRAFPHYLDNYSVMFEIYPHAMDGHDTSIAALSISTPVPDLLKRCKLSLYDSSDDHVFTSGFLESTILH